MTADPRFEQPVVWGHLADDPTIQQRAAMLEEMIPNGVTSILDVGCGDGAITNRLGRRWDVTGVDQSAEALQHVQTDAVRASALDLPFADGAFDLVLSSEMLEHLSPNEYRAATRELRRVARRYVLVSVPYREDLGFRTIRCPRCGWRGHVWGHRQAFTVESLIADLDGFGARQARVFGPRQDPVWPRWLLWLTHNVLRSFYWAPGQSPMCATCGNTDFSATRAIPPALRRLAVRVPGRRRVRLPFCLAVLAERSPIFD